MKSHELNVDSAKSGKRVGRGIAAGRGKTAGRGTKGQSARTGGKRRPGFEGGQNPLYARLPKLRGFTSHRTKAVTITTDDLAKLNIKSIDHATLVEAKLIDSVDTKIKVVLGRNEVSATINVVADNASVSAIAAIEKAGGSFKQNAARSVASANQKSN